MLPANLKNNFQIFSLNINLTLFAVKSCKTEINFFEEYRLLHQTEVWVKCGEEENIH